MMGFGIACLEAQRASVSQPRVRRTLGLPRPHHLMPSNPNGVPSNGDPIAIVIQHGGRNPVGVHPCFAWGGPLPRVAASPQPWAVLRNPFGIRKLLTAGTAE